jgi:hypothetical protein
MSSDNVSLASSSSEERTSSSTKYRSRQGRHGEKTSSKRKEKRGVRFSEYEEVVEIPHIGDLCEEEIRDVWMADEDFRSIQEECMGTVTMLGKGAVSNGFLLRGLDQHTLNYTESKDAIGRDLYTAVFRVQDFQRSTGVDAAELMAKICAKYSEPSVAAAQISAISDLFSCFKDTWSQRSIPTFTALPIPLPGL